jgi:hypothetical protein
MARIYTPEGLVIRFDENWLDIEHEPTGNGWFFFLDEKPSGPELGRHWWGQEIRFDEKGRRWSRHIKRLVADDFGTLVEVPA